MFSTPCVSKISLPLQRYLPVNLDASPERGGAEQSEAEGLIYDFVCKTPQSASPPAPLSGEPVRRIAGCPSVGFAASSPFRGAFYIDQLLPQSSSMTAPLSGEPVRRFQVAPQSASPPAPFSGEPSIPIICY